MKGKNHKENCNCKLCLGETAFKFGHKPYEFEHKASPGSFKTGHPNVNIYLKGCFKKGNKGHLNKPHSQETKEIIREKNKHKHYSRNTEIKKRMHLSISTEFKSGKFNPNWHGGITPLNKKLRSCSLSTIWREAVYLRDNFLCQNPDCKYCNNLMGVNIHAHHIQSWAEYPELRYDVSNGITYCKEFHINSKQLHKNISKCYFSKDNKIEVRGN